MQTLRLAFIWLEIYALEIHVAGCDDCLRCVTDQATINRILDARLTAKRELHRLRGVQRELRMMTNPWRLAK
jgi:hypothetical protein